MTFFACDSDLHNVILRLEHHCVLATEWFECNYRKTKQDKCHLIICIIFHLHKFEKCVSEYWFLQIRESND